MSNDTEGRDSEGRLAGSAAIQRLVDEIPEGVTWPDGTFMNTWDAADTAVESILAMEDAPEVAAAALRHLFALHLHTQEETGPTVAMHLLKVGDVVEMFGARRTVTEVLPGFVRCDGRQELYATTAGGRLPLIARPAQ